MYKEPGGLRQQSSHSSVTGCKLKGGRSTLVLDRISSLFSTVTRSIVGQDTVPLHVTESLARIASCRLPSGHLEFDAGEELPHGKTVFENGEQRGLFGAMRVQVTGGWRELHHEEY
jgi:hypothetical protein